MDVGGQGDPTALFEQFEPGEFRIGYKQDVPIVGGRDDAKALGFATFGISQEDPFAGLE